MAALTPTAASASTTAAPSQSVDEARRTAAASPAGQRAQLNAQILQASMDVSIKAGDDSLALLYRSAIDHINELLAPEFGPNALQTALQQDNSAEATAGRILSQSTAFFDAYAAQHQGKDAETVLRDFVGLIRGGFERGFGEARKILGGLGVLGEGSAIEVDIQKTHALVQKGYDDFLDTRLAALREGQAQNAAAPT
ncbi:DUF5610 domain-containing protein [Melaminivora sp.]|uniref:DUF5610 domain-containing protein n=1 Tax=Melaminivora sp. TaxID=1933032 RepID=UPI0028AD2402|nr:DUF5610 domain-containing protein [Melaminivora sp.]